MSSVISSTSTISSPYATVKEQVKPGKFEANEKEYGTVGAAVLGVGDAIAEGASATVSLSEKALNAVEDAGSYLGKAVETGITDVGSAAMAAYAAVRNGLGNTLDGVENAAEASWDTIKAGAEDVAGMAGDVVHAAEAGAAAVADVAVDAWHGVEHLASETLHGIERGTAEVEHLGSEAWTALENGTQRARDLAAEAGDRIKTAAGHVGDGIGDVADGIGNVAGRMASYATVGAAAVERAFSAVV
jgi:phage-related protein